MYRYLLKIFFFFVLVAVTDCLFGHIGDYLRDHTKGGFSGNIHHICENCNEDLIMMGSSRMRHHYVPQVFQDSLGLSCYNAGIDGNGIIMAYGFLEMIVQRYSPKLIIYDVSSFDMYLDDNSKYLGPIRPYYQKERIREIFVDVDAAEKWKMRSGMYRYNSKILGLLGDNILPMQSFDNGYWPFNKVMDYDPVLPEGAVPVVDSLKLSYVSKFIRTVKDNSIPLIFVASPTWFGAETASYNDPVKRICNEEGVVFLDHFYDEYLCCRKEYWSDATHLNDSGARFFSRMLVQDIKRACP